MHMNEMAVLDAMVVQRMKLEQDQAVSAYWRNRPRKPLDGNRRVSVPIDLGGKPHGVRAGYRAGCRCRPCGDAQSAYASKARRARLASI